MTRLWGTALALALFAAAMWFAWLGWDHEYYEVDGVAQGPYRAWQVVGCGLAIALATVLAHQRVRRNGALVVLALAAVIGFAVPWAVDASRSDDTGLWAVGLFLLLIGGTGGLAVLLAVTDAVVGRNSSPSGALTICCVLTVVVLLYSPLLAVVPLAATAFVFFHRWLPERRRGRGDLST
jgi:hypothetical protein